ARAVLAASGQAPSGNGERLVLPWGDDEVDFTPPWPRKRYADLFREFAGCEMSDADGVREKAREQARLGNIKQEFIEHMNSGQVHPDVIVSEVFEACVEDQLTGP